MQQNLASIGHSGVDNEPLPRLSRSPHPYARRALTESLRLDISDTTTPSQSESCQAQVKTDRRTHAVGGPRASPEVSSSDVEEDKVLQLKALPPTPVRPRKGLRVPIKANDYDVSPLLTPSALHEEEEKLARGYFTEATGDAALSKDDIDRARARFQARRRGELLRRGCEVLLVAVIAVVVLCGQGVWDCVKQCSRDLTMAVNISLCLLALYPLRLALRPILQDGRFKMGEIQIPSAFDPAPMLYPPLIPILAALSVASGDVETVRLNIILGLCSLPAKLIPVLDSNSAFNDLHWTIVLLLLRQATLFGNHTELSLLAEQQITIEGMSIVFPLHQTLGFILSSLTTTSLLTSEVQLLSTGLVNLLILSTSPQACILFTLLWIGGVLLLLGCSRVVQWNLALERISLQKLHKTSRALSAGSKSFIHTLSRSLSHMQGRDETVFEDDLESPIEETKIDISGNGKLADRPAALQRPQSNASYKNRRRGSSVTYSTFSLSPQAIEVRKWVYAGWCYLVIALVILLPVRSLVQRTLNGHEPFGWAIGYLFGDLPPLQTFLVDHSLQNWIPLPLITANSISPHLQSYLPLTIHPSTLRLSLILYAFLVLFTGITTVVLLTPYLYVDTRRKIFHFTMVCLLLPTTPLDPCFLSLALTLILAIFLLLDFIRAAQLRPLSKPIAQFLTPYVDGRDLCGPVVVSHIFLLIGCAIPLWLSLAAVPRAGAGPWAGWEIKREDRDLSMLAGVICVGMGDAAASLVGRRFGRRKWPWAGGKSLEGSAAFAVAVMIGLGFGKVWLGVGGWGGSGSDGLEWLWNGEIVSVVGRIGVAAMGASLMEAVLTGCNDNVVVPVVLWLLVRGLRL